MTTNKVVAEKADVTSAALYHYFDSKLEMYLAVYDDAQELVGEEFGAAAADERHLRRPIRGDAREGIPDELARPVARPLPRIFAS